MKHLQGFTLRTKEWWRKNIYPLDVTFPQTKITFEVDETIKSHPIRYSVGYFEMRSTRKIVAKIVSDMWGIEPTRYYEPRGDLYET